jgi:hypothetical protein
MPPPFTAPSWIFSEKRSNQTQQARAVKVHQSKIMQKPGFIVTDVAKEFAGY